MKWRKSECVKRGLVLQLQLNGSCKTRQRPNIFFDYVIIHFYISHVINLNYEKNVPITTYAFG